MKYFITVASVVAQALVITSNATAQSIPVDSGQPVRVALRAGPLIGGTLVRQPPDGLTFKGLEFGLVATRVASVETAESSHWSRRTHTIIGAMFGVVAAPLLYAATHDTTIVCHRDMADCDYGPFHRLGAAVLIGGAVGAGIGWFLPAGG